jgi:hypothetical protein
MVHIVGENKKDEVVDNRTWEEKATECAQNFSYAMEERFVGTKMRIEHMLPKNPTREIQAQAAGILIDYLVGTTVAILCNGQPADTTFEENMVDIVRDKFSRLREMAKGK